VVFRIDPKVFALRPYHEKESRFRGQEATNVVGWARRLPLARLIINGGQYYPDRRAMGFLKRSGEVLEKRAHPSYLGYLAQDGSASGLYDSPGVEDQKLWEAGSILQSYMVIGGQGEIRARLSDRLASRTILGQDRESRLLAILAPGAATLADLGQLALELGVVMAIGLDGGLEAQIAYRDPELKAEFGAYSRWLLGPYRVAGGSPTLPVVLAVEKIG
jgi:exopolysaccharide biosynthesis protein